MKSNFLLFSLCLLLFYSCSKETNCVNQLNGSWTISSMTLVDPSGTEYNMLDNGNATTTGFFEISKYNTASPDERGTLRQTMTVFSGGQTLSQTTNQVDYRLDEECTKIMAYDSTSVDPYEYATIIELSNSSATLQNADPSFGTVTTILTR